MLTERGSGGEVPQWFMLEIHAQEDTFSAAAALRSRGRGVLHGSVGQRFHTVTSIQSPACHLSHLQEDGRTLSQVCKHTSRPT